MATLAMGLENRSDLLVVADLQSIRGGRIGRFTPGARKRQPLKNQKCADKRAPWLYRRGHRAVLLAVGSRSILVGGAGRCWGEGGKVDDLHRRCLHRRVPQDKLLTRSG